MFWLDTNNYLISKQKCKKYYFAKNLFKLTEKFSHVVYEYIIEEIAAARIRKYFKLIIKRKFAEDFIKPSKSVYNFHKILAIWVGLDFDNNNFQFMFEVYFYPFFKNYRSHIMKYDYFMNFNLLKLNLKYKKILFLYYSKGRLRINLKPGIICKKFKILDKKLKKSPKILNLMLKTGVEEIKTKSKRGIILNIYGTSFINNTVIKTIKKYLNLNETPLIYSMKIVDKIKKIKRIKRIKRNSLKNFLKNYDKYNSFK